MAVMMVAVGTHGSASADCGPVGSWLSTARSSGEREATIPSLCENCSNFKFIYLFLFIYFWLRCVFIAAQAFSSCGEQGPLSFGVHGLLIAVASLVADHGL